MMKKLTIFTFMLLIVALMAACTVSEPAPNPSEEISVPKEALPIAPEPVLPEATPSTEVLEESDVLDDNASSESSDVSWAEALEFLNNGDVTLVAQSHDLEVSLVLKDGRTVTAVEPSIDAIFKAIEACGEACSNIVLMTE
jgi:hypothetical protein